MNTNNSSDEVVKKLKSLYILTRLFLLMWIVSALLFIASAYFMLGRALFFASLIGMPVFFILWKVTSRRKKTFASDSVTYNTLLQNFQLIEYDYKKHIDEALLNDLGSRNWSIIKGGSDYIHAIHRGVEFKFCNIKLGDRDEDGTSTVFAGQWLIVKLDRDIWPRMLISEGHPLGKIRAERIIFLSENDKFNKRFMICGDDPQMAVHLVTPRFVENIMTLDQATNNASKGKKLFFINRGNLHIAIASARSFFEAANPSMLLTKTQDDINCIKYLIDVFRSNERLFKPDRF